MRIVSPLKFRPLRSALFAASALGMASLIHVIMIIRGTNPVSYLLLRLEWSVFLVALYAGTLWFAFLGGVILFALTVVKSPLYVENSRLIYLHRWLWSAKLSSIKTIHEQRDGGSWPVRGALRVELENGKDKWLSTLLIRGRQSAIAKSVTDFLEEIKIAADEVTPAAAP